MIIRINVIREHISLFSIRGFVFKDFAVSSRFFAKLSLYPKFTPDFADLTSEKDICLTDNNINYFRETNTCVLT